MGAVEILWMFHTDTIVNLAQNKKSQVRRYLNDTRDYVTLREWDNQQMSDRASDGGRGDGYL